MNLHLYLSMSAFALAASISPGPVNIVSLSAGATHGLHATMRHVSGATFGFTLLLLLIGLGLNELLLVFPNFTVWVQWAGVVFLVYLAWQLLRDSGQLGDAEQMRRPSFLSGALMQWLNPKAWLASVAGMGAYASDGSLSLVLQFALIYFVVCYLSLAVWAYVGAYLARYVRNPIYLRWLNRTLAVLLLVSAGFLMLENF